MKSFEERLEAETSAWVAEGLITGDQRVRVLARHAVPGSETGHSRFFAILATAGGALFVVGVSLVIKSNWEQIGDWVKILGLVALLATAWTVGWRLKVAPGEYPKTGDAFLMAGAVFFLLGIALVSQVFHIDRRPADGVLIWWVGIVALPWVTRARGAQFVSVVAGLTWLGMELASDDAWLRFGHDTANWGEARFYWLASAGFLIGAALAFFGLGLRRGTQAHFAGLHEKVGLLVACWALYLLGFSWTQRHWNMSTMDAVRWPALLVVVVPALVAGAWAWRRNGAELRPLLWWLAPGIVPVAAHLLGLDLLDSGWFWGGWACVALFVLNLGMIRIGIATGREGWINLGMIGIALNIVTRYFLLFGTMLEGGVFFIVTGLLVLGLGYYLERKRRALIGVVRREEGIA